LYFSIENLISLQYDNLDIRLDGAIRINEEDMKIRVDTTQHTIDDFKKIVEVLQC